MDECWKLVKMETKEKPHCSREKFLLLLDDIKSAAKGPRRGQQNLPLTN